MNKRQLRLFIDDNNHARDQPESTLVAKASEAKDYISSIWTFPESTAYQLYRWYGTLPRPLVERLISLYAKNKKSRVLDPFMGTGTSLDVAAEANLWATGIDNNPLACLIAEAKLSRDLSGPSVLNTVDKIAENLRTIASGVFETTDREWSDYIANKSYEYTRKWFRKDTLNALLALLFQIAEIQDEQIQRLLFVAAAQVVREVASVDPRCTHHLVTKKKNFINPVPLWRQEVSQIMEAIRNIPIDPLRISIIQGSVFECNLEGYDADFVLIHPPYLGMIHYHLIHRLATDLLGIVSSAKTPVSIRKYNFQYQQIKRTDVSTDDSGKYWLFVRKLAELMQHVLVPNGRVAVIIGDQRYRGNLRHPFTDFIYWFEKCNFALEESFIWILQNNAGMHVLRRGHFIDHNYILVFRKKVG